jgi:hypothetical protein
MTMRTRTPCTTGISAARSAWDRWCATGNFSKKNHFLDLLVAHLVMRHGYIYTHGVPPIPCVTGNIFKNKSHSTPMDSLFSFAKKENDKKIEM